MPDDEPKPTRDPGELSELLVEHILEKRPDLDPEDLEGVESAKDLLKLLGKQSVATEIIELVKQTDAVLFHDDDQTPFASFTVDGHVETWPSSLGRSGCGSAGSTTATRRRRRVARRSPTRSGCSRLRRSSRARRLRCTSG